MKPLDFNDKVRLSARGTLRVVILTGGMDPMPKRRHLRLYWGDDGRPYVNVGRRTDRHREYLAEAVTVIPGDLYTFRTEKEVALRERERKEFDERYG